MVEYRDVVMEDLSTLERIRRALDTGQIREFHFHDHELALRHQHKVVSDVLSEYDRRQAETSGGLSPFEVPGSGSAQVAGFPAEFVFADIAFFHASLQ